MESNSASGAFMAGQRTVIDRALFGRLIDALLDGDEDTRIRTAKELSDTAPSWWSGSTRHRVGARQAGTP